MHDAGAVGEAIEKVIADWPKTGRGGQLELEIRDATRASADAVALRASYYLVEHGFGTVTFTLTINDIHCAQCGELAVKSTPARPWCDHCGTPPAPGPRTSRGVPGGFPMCLMMPGRVVAVDGQLCEVDISGQVDKASMMLEPDLVVGDWVLVNSGTVVRVLDEDQAAEMSRAFGILMGAPEETATPAD